MLISILTPTHGGSKYLLELYECIKKQTHTEWEWIVVRNNGGDTFGIENQDNRVKVFDIENADKSVGRAKRFAAQQAKGEILVEVDHDDLITPDALEEVKKAFDSDPEVVQVYSNFAEFFYNHPKMKDWESNKYDSAYGWQYRMFEWEGHRLNECIDFEPNPASFAMIWFAPNHIRAWRTKPYWEAGGHDENLPAVDDFDLELRLYLKGKFKKIDKCLYLYRMTGGNTWIEKNKFIQEKAREKADEYTYRIVERWAELKGLPVVSMSEIPCDLNGEWPYPTNSVGVVKAFDKLQLCGDPIHVMKEIYRVLVPGGWILSSTPSTDGRGAFENPLFKSFWNENSFNYYIHQGFAGQIGNPGVKFQEIRRKTYFPSDWSREANISYVLFDGIAIKEGMPRLPGYKDWKI